MEKALTPQIKPFLSLHRGSVRWFILIYWSKLFKPDWKVQKTEGSDCLSGYRFILSFIPHPILLPVGIIGSSSICQIVCLQWVVNRRNLVPVTATKLVNPSNQHGPSNSTSSPACPTSDSNIYQDFNFLFPPMESQGKVDIFPPDLEETPWPALHTTLHPPHLIKPLNIVFIGSAFVHLCYLATTEVFSKGAYVALKPVYTFQHCWCLSRCALP